VASGGKTGASGDRQGERGKDRGEQEKMEGAASGDRWVFFPKWWNEKTNSLLLMSLTFSTLFHDITVLEALTALDAPAEI